MTAEETARKLMHACAEHGYVSAECAEDTDHPCVITWSEHAVEHLAAMLDEYTRSQQPEWRRDGNPPVGAEIVFASAHTMGMGVIDADTPPMPPGMWWCHAGEARRALGLAGKQ
ncbi:MAG: hypothetical protein WC992_05145 [Acholeplasmataceae bacterium]|jgi:hypothetical protein